MAQVLGIVASPRKLGNSEILVKEIGRRIPGDHDIRLLRLHDFRIDPCIGCYRCLFGEEQCVLEDDLQRVIDALVDADAYIVAAPTYFLSANARLKVLLDRGLALLAHIDALWGKPAVGVGVAGIEGRAGAIHRDIHAFLKLILADVKAVRTVYGALPGEVFTDGRGADAAKSLGEALFQDPLPSDAPACPVCGGDTFRFLRSDRVRCMTCGNPGSVETGPAGPVFRVAPGDHEFFTSKAAAVSHREWLRGMKDQFLERKQEMKEATKDFRKGWTWIRPGA